MSKTRTGLKFKYKLWDKLGYIGKHNRIRKLYGKANKCIHRKCEGKCKIYEWSNKSRNILEKKSDWWMLCSKCHKTYDRS